MSYTPAMVQVAATGKVEATATEKADVGESTNKADDGSAAAAGGDGSNANATEGSIPVRGCYRCGKKGHIRRCSGRVLGPGRESRNRDEKFVSRGA